MAKDIDFNYFCVGDFETTVNKIVYDENGERINNQTTTEAWASAVAFISDDEFGDDVKIFNSIDKTFKFLVSLNGNVKIFYHNLKFDGSFWINYLMKDLKLDISTNDKIGDDFRFLRELKDNTFTYMISDMGQWYSIRIKYNGKYIEILDSLKLLPFKVKDIGEGFKTKHRKLEMEYTGDRHEGGVITDEEKEYIRNDVLVVKEALEVMLEEGHLDSMTIGSCCMEEFKNLYGNSYYRDFPNLYFIDLPQKLQSTGVDNYGEFIKASYHGGWCYVKEEAKGKIYNQGITADVNSLYPSMMHSMSGNYYPVGKPNWFVGDIPFRLKIMGNEIYYFVKIRCRFELKEGYLPFIQIKNSHLYSPREMLTTSDFIDLDGNRYRYVEDENGDAKDTVVELTLSQTDYELFKEHYNIYDLQVLGGCYFYTKRGLFDSYIDKYAEIKKTSKGAKRQLAKLFLNNLCGKFATSIYSSFKVAYVKEDGSLGYKIVYSEDKRKAGYIAIGAAITSYARAFTIRAAQANYDRFCYADTDSIHCYGTIDDIKGIKIHPVDFCCWKIETYWDKGKFVRPKTYVEHVTHEDGEPVKVPFYNIKCAGMPERCKDLLEESMVRIGKVKPKTREEVEFLKKDRTLDDFDIGLKVPSKLMPKNINGGILLVDTSFVMRA